MSSFRLRAGILLWLVSWLPIAVIVGATGTARAAIWTTQVVIGIAGIALAGTVFAKTIKSVGWRATPGAAWSLFAHGSEEVTA